MKLDNGEITMKTNRQPWFLFIVVSVVLIGLATSSACKRSSIDDPSTIGPAGFRVILSANANPSTLYIQKGQTTSTLITVRALKNDGTPMSSKYIIFDSDIMNIGYFGDHKQSDIQVTDSTGTAKTTFYIPPGTGFTNDVIVNVTATYSDDGRLDNTISAVYNKIPIKLKPAAVPSLVTDPAVVNAPAASAGNTYTIKVINPTTDDVLLWELSSETTWISYAPKGGNTLSTFILTIQTNNTTGVQKIGYVNVIAVDALDNPITDANGYYITASLTIIQDYK